jgi:formate-dependent nitrite reductase membrane component NrfD
MMRRMWFRIVPGTLILIAIVLVLGLFLVKVMWAWVVPDIFPEAVNQGLVAEAISWLTSFKIAIALALFSGFVSGAFKGRRFWHPHYY